MNILETLEMLIYHKTRILYIHLNTFLQTKLNHNFIGL